MITENTIEIDAPAPDVWGTFVEVERWPEWTASVQRIVPLDGTDLGLGRRFEIKQPYLPRLVWEVTELEPGRSWAWRQRSPGGLTVASHDVTPIDDGRTLVRQRIDQRGPIGIVIGLLMLRLTRRYLHLEAYGLKGRCEHRQRPDTTGRAPPEGGRSPPRRADLDSESERTHDV